MCFNLSMIQMVCITCNSLHILKNIFARLIVPIQCGQQGGKCIISFLMYKLPIKEVLWIEHRTCADDLQCKCQCFKKIVIHWSVAIRNNCDSFCNYISLQVKIQLTKFVAVGNDSDRYFYRAWRITKNCLLIYCLMHIYLYYCIVHICLILKQNQHFIINKCNVT